MSRHPVPDAQQAQRLAANGIDPEEQYVVHDGGDYLLLKNYRTGDEIVVRWNVLKKGVKDGRK